MVLRTSMFFLVNLLYRHIQVYYHFVAFRLHLLININILVIKEENAALDTELSVGTQCKIQDHQEQFSFLSLM